MSDSEKDIVRIDLTDEQKDQIKAATEKVSGDAYEAWVRDACVGQLAALRNAIIAFNVKNGMSRKDAASDADLTVDDYVASSVDHYKFMAEVNKPQPAAQAAAPPPTPAATPAAAPQQPK